MCHNVSPAPVSVLPDAWQWFMNKKERIGSLIDQTSCLMFLMLHNPAVTRCLATCEKSDVLPSLLGLTDGIKALLHHQTIEESRTVRRTLLINGLEKTVQETQEGTL